MSDLDPAGPADPTAPVHTRDGSRIILERGVSATMEVQGLVLKDSQIAKRNRSKQCSSLWTTRSKLIIPYYHILSASTGISDENELIINYVVNKDRPFVSHLRYALGPTTPGEAQYFLDHLLIRAYGRAQQQPRAKVLVNPHAGPGGATRLWERDVKPLFEAAGIIMDVVVTTRSGEGRDICKLLNLDLYDIVVVCSGDGLAYEVFNGFGDREDARVALQKIAVAHIPCGSGNAMSCNLNGTNHPAAAALTVIKGVRTTVDLMSVTQGPDRHLSFLSQSFGIIADCDLGTENLRWMGAKRFDMGVLQRIFSKKVYPCDISIKVEIEDKIQVKAHYKRFWIGDKGNQQEGSHSSEPADPFQSEEDVGLPPLRFGTVNDPLPEDWETTTCPKLGNFYCGNMGYMAPDANFFPAAWHSDGLMDVVINDGDLGPMEYVGLMTSIESGKFFDNPLLSYRKVVAYRLTPRAQEDGYISVDGEQVLFQPFQVEVHRGLGTVISKNGRYESPGPMGWEKTL